MDILLQPWAWYVSGPLIALVLFFFFFFGKNFGVSTNLETLCTIAGAGKILIILKKIGKNEIGLLFLLLGYYWWIYYYKLFITSASYKLNPNSKRFS